MNNKTLSVNHGEGSNAALPLAINHWGIAAIAFFVPMIVYFIFRINLAPLFEIDAKFVVGSYNIDISTVFSGNPYHYRPLSLLLEAKIGYLYKLYGTKYHTDIIGIIAVLHGLLSLLIYGICFHCGYVHNLRVCRFREELGTGEGFGHYG